MPIRMKMTVLTQEVFRRLHNTKENIPEETKKNMMNRFMENLRLSGYTERQRLEILKGGYKTYDRLKEKELKGERPFYRPSTFKRNERKKSKEKKKNDWFKTDENIKSVIFVEATPDSELIRKLKETENKHKIDDENRIKFVEKCGTKIMNLVSIADPFRKNCPPEKDCLPCRGNTTFSNCRKTDVGYQMWCKICKSRGFEQAYEGETCRNLYLRGREHQNLFKNDDQNSVIRKHVRKVHEN